MSKNWDNAKPEDLWSTPITNVIQADVDIWTQYHKEFVAFHQVRRDRAKHAKVVKWHKDTMGRQAYCFTGWRRYWVWEAYGHWRVYVNNTAGIGFEVNHDATPEAALYAWHSYLRMMDMAEVIGTSGQKASNETGADSVS